MTEYVKTHKCKSCGAKTSGRGHLCHPNQDAPPEKCDFCGEETSDALHSCPDMVDKMEYSCKNCGRVAVYGSLLCEPEVIE